MAARTTIAFDPESAEHARNWPQTLAQLRQKCPLAWTEAHGGFWVVSSYSDLTRIARDPETFSSAKTFDAESGTYTGGASIPPFPKAGAVPLEVDPPLWNLYRDLLNPHFGPKAAEDYRRWTIALADQLIDGFIEIGRADIVRDYTSAIPTLLTVEILGIDVEDWRKFVEPVHRMVHTSQASPEFPKIIEGVHWIEAQLRAHAEKSRRTPGRGIISAMAHAKVDGEPLPIDLIERMGMLIIGGGAHTTTALTSHAFHYLHQHPERRRELLDDPEALARAREEFIRFYSPVHGLARTVTETVDINGQQLCPGERVLLMYSSANRDEAAFERADEVVLDRFPNRHVGFGIGIHRCLGSFYARMMFEVIMTRLLERVPDYRIVEDQAVPSSLISKINTWVSLPITFTPGARLQS